MVNSDSPVVGVVIPALNEEASIALVLKEIPQERIRKIVVVDNGCTDRTAEVARANGATVVKEPLRGYGAACLKGIAALGPVDIVVFVDADYSDSPSEMNVLLDKIEEGYDLVIGSRLLGGAEPGALLPQARFGNQLACFLMKLLFHHRYTDLGPFRAIRFEALKKINMEDRAFGWTVEMQVKAVLHGLKIAEVPVSYKKRVGVSKITGTVKGTFLAGTTILTIIFTSWLKIWLSRAKK